MKKFVALLLLLCFLPTLAMAEEKQAIPEIFHFTQKTTEDEYLRKNVYVRRTYPVTANEKVNEEMRAVIDGMTEAGQPHLPNGWNAKEKISLRVSSGISRTGQSWMSFLTLARIQAEAEQTYVDFDARVYDLATGHQLTLLDLFDASSPAWETIAKAVKTQLSAYYPEEEADAETLAQLCEFSQLQETPFTLTAGTLRLHYHTDALYPGHAGLMHVRIPYGEIRDDMLEEAQRQTDNSCYKMVALTFDDGPAQLSSIRVIDMLRQRGADATFFLVGNMLRANHYVVSYEHDSGFILAYHSYHHETSGSVQETALSDLQRFNAELSAITGTSAAMMRAPGGVEKPYIEAEIGLPLIHWSISAGDGSMYRSYADSDILTIGMNAGGGCPDGAVVMMHDLREACYKYLDIALNRLEERGFLCVTVEELFAARGITLENNQTYYGEK